MKSEKDKHHIISLMCGIENKLYKWTYLQNRLTDIEKKFMVTKGENGEGNGTPLQYSCLENPMDGGPGRLQSMGSLSQTWLSDFTLTSHFPALEREMATHSSVLAWRILGMGEPGGLPSMGSHRVGHDWGNLAAAAAALMMTGTWSEKKKKWSNSLWWFMGFFFSTQTIS